MPKPAEGEKVEENIIDRVLSVEKFTPLPPIAAVKAPQMSPIDRTVLLMAINATRTGAALLKVAVSYDKQIDDGDDRIAGKDYIEVPGCAGGKMHIGTLVFADFNKKGELYLRMVDDLRSNGEDVGWTSMIPRGIRSFQILSTKPGPAAVPATQPPR